MDIRNRVIEIVADQLNIDAEEVAPTSHFIDDLGADSLDIVELIMTMEEEFDISISDEEAEKIQVVQDAIDYINNHTMEEE